MKVNDPNLSSAGLDRRVEDAGDRTNRAQLPGCRRRRRRAAAAASDDIHLSELVRSLRSLAADSPERQARIEQIARAYANGTYQVDAQATASGIIDDALRH